MVRSPDSLIPSSVGQPTVEKRDDKAFRCRKEGEANSRAATQVNVVEASSTLPAIIPTQLEFFPGRACPLKAKPATDRIEASKGPIRRDGVRDGSTRRKSARITGETLFGPAETFHGATANGREAYKGQPRKRGPEAGQGVGGGHSTGEARDNRVEGRTAASTKRLKRGKAAGLRPRGSARTRPKPAVRMDKARKLQRALYRAAKQQPERRFTLLYDKVCRYDILGEAWKRVKQNGGAAGVDKVSIEQVRESGEAKFLEEIQGGLQTESYRASKVRRVHIPKPGQPGRTRPLGIPIIKDRVVQMAVKLVIEPLFEPDFMPCSYGFRPKRTPRQGMEAIVRNYNERYRHVVDVDLKSYFDTIDHNRLMRLVERRVGDVRVLRLIRAWLKAGIVEEGKETHPVRGTPQGGVISPLLSNIFLHEVDRQWQEKEGQRKVEARLVRYADDMVLMARTEKEAQEAWEEFQGQIERLDLEINREKSKLTTFKEGFAFLGFEFRSNGRLLYMWPRTKAVHHIVERVRTEVKSTPTNEPLHDLIRKMNPILNGWCTYYRVGNSNRTFHEVDWHVRGMIQIWLRRKHKCRWRRAKKRWNYHALHSQCRLYRMVGKVSHLEGLRRKPPEEGGRRAVCGKSARTVRRGKRRFQESS